MGEVEVPVLRVVSLSIRRGEIVVLTADWDDRHRRYDWVLRIFQQALQYERMNNGWQVTRT